MAQKQKLELTWIGKEKRQRLEPRILLTDPGRSHEEPAPLGQAVIARRRFLTTRTAPAYAGMRLYGDHDRRRVPLQTMHAHFLVYEPDESLHLIQDGLNL